MLNKLNEKIKNNQIINASLFEDCDVDELLDMRDDDFGIFIPDSALRELIDMNKKCIQKWGGKNERKIY